MPIIKPKRVEAEITHTASYKKTLNPCSLVTPIDLSTPCSQASSLAFWLNDTKIMKKEMDRIMIDRKIGYRLIVFSFFLDSSTNYFKTKP